MNIKLFKRLPVILGGLLVIVACNARIDKMESRVIETKNNPAYCDGMLYYMGIRVDTLLTKEDSLHHGESVYSVLKRYHLSPEVYRRTAKTTTDSLRARKMNASRKFLAITDGSGPDALRYIVFRQSPGEYLICNVSDSAYAYWYKKPVMKRERFVAGEVVQSMNKSLRKEGLDNKLIKSLAEIFAWTIDFSRLQSRDKYKLVVEEEVVDGAIVKVTGIKAAMVEHKGKPYYACQYMVPGEEEARYYDESGHNLRQAFLKMPLKYGTLTSRYNLNRFHPILNSVKPHLGTDFAAPTGTPILATGTGVVVEATRTTYNGNYVKIKHNNSYMTQYLHMKGFAKGIKKGTKVKQGDVIGYVGMTGLATGPHVCYRFWKNGKQVDPLKDKKASFTEPINPANKSDFFKVFASYKHRMDGRTFDYAPVLHSSN